MKPRTPKNFERASPEAENKYNNARSANYDIMNQSQPRERMGADDFACMPKDPIMRDFSHERGYRDGIINDFDSSIKDISGIRENRK